MWTSAKGVTTDTVVNAGARDWKMVLAPGTGVALGADRLGGSLNAGLSNDGDALYLYLPGPDGNSAGTDNVYLDFVSWEDDKADGATQSRRSPFDQRRGQRVLHRQDRRRQ